MNILGAASLHSHIHIHRRYCSNTMRCLFLSNWYCSPLSMPFILCPQNRPNPERVSVGISISLFLKVTRYNTTLGLYSLSGKTSYRKISRSLVKSRFRLFQSLWNLAGTSAALLPRCLSNFRAIRPLQHPISRLRDFTRFGGKTSYRLVNRGLGDLDGHFDEQC